PAASGGDADAYIEPGEGGTVNVQFSNDGDGPAKNVTATLTTSTAGVTVTTGSSSYADLAPGASGANATPFAFSLASTVACGELVHFTLTLHFTRGSTQLDRPFDFDVQTGQPDNNYSTVSYTGPAVAIPDGDAAGVNIPVTVSGFTGNIRDLNFRFDGSACTDADGATTVGLDHTWLGDLVVKLTSPQGTTVVLYDQEMGNYNNFCQTVYDDEAGGYLDGSPPFTGTFKPARPLSAFDGENPNGTWVLNVSDNYSWDTGNVRAFSLLISDFQCN
ncbi:MAG TPA: proprotein convertase P-domain-containing protein, partial [Pyrinomonadaceae bacterium]|nr:proprotein convertase P-domain-containing protein [Pyrinomonadaceae bacterium]